jgi:hypothetical protein
MFFRRNAVCIPRHNIKVGFMDRHFKERNTLGQTESFFAFALSHDLKKFFNGEETFTIG